MARHCRPETTRTMEQKSNNSEKGNSRIELYFRKRRHHICHTRKACSGHLNAKHCTKMGYREENKAGQ
jgi:hypothetical protein